MDRYRPLHSHHSLDDNEIIEIGDDDEEEDEDEDNGMQTKKVM